MSDVSLRDYIERLIAEHDLRYQQRWEASQDALNKAEEIFDKYRHDANQWRSAVADERSERVSRSEWATNHTQLTSRMESELRFISDRLDRMDKERNAIKDVVTRLDSRSGYLSVSVAMSIIAVILSLLHIWARAIVE